MKNTKRFSLILMLAFILTIIEPLSVYAGARDTARDLVKDEVATLTKTNYSNSEDGTGKEYWFYTKLPCAVKLTAYYVARGKDTSTTTQMLSLYKSSGSESLSSKGEYSSSDNWTSYKFTGTCSKGDLYLAYSRLPEGVSKANVYFTATMAKKPTLSSVKKASSKSIKLTWKPASGATGYMIYRSTSKNGTYKLIKTTSSGARTYTDSKLSKGKTYYYKIRAVSKNDYGSYYSGYTSIKKLKL